MKTILKRTTAVAALAALPLAPIAVQAQNQGEQSQSQSQYGVQSQSELVPSDKDIKIYKSQKESAPAKADVTKTQSGYEERSTENAGQDNDDTGASTADNTAQNAIKGKPDQAAASDTQTGQSAAQGQTSGAFQGKDVEAGVEPGEPPAQEQTQAKAGAGQEADVLVAKVGDSEIRRSDVLGVIGTLPPQLQQQPPEMLIPLALDQLVLRELILQEAQKEGLENDPEVTGMVTDASEQARENAMVQVWLDRQLSDAVTESKVNETYGAIQGQLGAETPELEQIRPQIEQELRRQAFNEISTDLQADADITVYGPDGQPVTQ